MFKKYKYKKDIIEDINNGIAKCYICNKEAKYYIRPGGPGYVPCCQPVANLCEGFREYFSKCLKKKSPNSKLWKKIDEGKAKCFMCGRKAKFLINKKPCCSKKGHGCPEFNNYLSKRRQNKKKNNPKEYKKWCESLKEAQNRPEVKESKSKSMKKLHRLDPIFRKNYKKGKAKATKTMRTPEYRLECSKRFKKLFKDPIFRKSYVDGVMKAAHNLKMNREEQKLYTILDILYPDYFSFNYKNKFRINNMSPDFYNIEDKVIIESFGTYWHRQVMKKKKLTRKKYEKERTDKLKKLGWKCLIIWTYEEIENRSVLIDKIRDFVGD